jgi:hypothetical protein
MNIPDFAGFSRRFHAVLDNVWAVASAQCSVLVQGEAGTGQSAAARLPRNYPSLSHAETRNLEQTTLSLLGSCGTRRSKYRSTAPSVVSQRTDSRNAEYPKCGFPAHVLLLCCFSFCQTESGIVEEREVMALSDFLCSKRADHRCSYMEVTRSQRRFHFNLYEGNL